MTVATKRNSLSRCGAVRHRWWLSALRTRTQRVPKSNIITRGIQKEGSNVGNAGVSSGGAPIVLPYRFRDLYALPLVTRLFSDVDDSLLLTFA